MTESTSTAREQQFVPIVNLTIEGDVVFHVPSAGDSGATLSALIALADHATPKNDQTQKPTTSANAEAPSIIVPHATQPLKIMADGHHVDARELVTDHVALLFPETGWMIGVHTLCREEQRPFASQPDTIAAAKASRLLGYDDWMLADDVVYSRHVIDRRFYNPAVDTNLYPRLLLTDWYWTSTTTPRSESSAFCVNLYGGVVDSGHRDYSGFGLACRRARQ